MRIILGSRSKGRMEVLKRMGCRFETMAADIDEKAIRDNDPRRLTLSLAHAKADALLPHVHTGLLITSDQVVVCNGAILEKPENSDEARRYLEGYADFPAETVTAVVVTNIAIHTRVEGVDVAKVVFRRIPLDVIDRVIHSGEVLHHAGAFSLEDPLLKDYIVRVEGEPESVMGLPAEMTKRLLKEAQ
ncbi:MAG: Maf family protein [Syntrophorhabdales bacterium]